MVGTPSEGDVGVMDGVLDLPRRSRRAVRPVGSVFLLASGEPGRVRAPTTRFTSTSNLATPMIDPLNAPIVALHLPLLCTTM